MYFRKYYAGTVGADMTVSAVQDINGVSHSIQKERTEVMNRAVEETLAEAGMDCRYDPETCMLTAGGCSLNLFTYNNSTWKLIKKNRQGYDTNVVQSGSSSYSPFGGTGYKDYKFYVTVRGEPKGLLEVYIGYYSIPAATSYGFFIGFGKDIRDGADIVFISANGTGFYVQGREDAFPAGVNPSATYTFTRYVVNDAGLSVDGSLKPLIGLFSDNGFFSMDNCCFSSNDLVARNFYNIGGDIYYCVNQYILVKCITELPE